MSGSRSGLRMAVYGKSQSGKTYYVKKMIADKDRIVVFDPEEQFEDLPGFYRAKDLADFLSILSDCWDGAFRVIYTPTEMNEEAELHQVARIVQELQEPYKRGEHDQKVMFVVDEAQDSFGMYVKPKHNGFGKIMSKGGKRGIDVVYIAQRPAEVNPRARGNLDRVASFALAFINDIEAAEKAMQVPGTGEKIQNLAKFHHVYRDENGEVRIVPPT